PRTGRECRARRPPVNLRGPVWRNSRSGDARARGQKEADGGGAEPKGERIAAQEERCCSVSFWEAVWSCCWRCRAWRGREPARAVGQTANAPRGSASVECAEAVRGI